MLIHCRLIGIIVLPSAMIIIKNIVPWFSFKNFPHNYEGLYMWPLKHITLQYYNNHALCSNLNSSNYEDFFIRVTMTGIYNYFISSWLTN